MQEFIPYYVKIRGFNIYLLLDTEKKLIANSVPIKDRDTAWSIFSEVIKNSINIRISKSRVRIGKEHEKRIANMIVDIVLGISNNINKDFYKLIISPRYIAVLRLLRKIPRGRVTTYSSIAKLLGIHPRQVGIALRKNPLPVIYPCHRVVKSDRSIGGYIGSRYRWLKRELLVREGIRIVNDRVFKRYIIDIAEMNLNGEV